MPLIKTKNGLSHGVPPDGLQPHLRVKLKKEWRYNLGRGAFHDLSGKLEGYVTPRLPADSRVVPMVLALAEADPRKLSKDELNLARYVYIMLPGCQTGKNPQRSAWLAFRRIGRAASIRQSAVERRAQGD